VTTITSGQSNLTSDHIAATDGRFNRIHQVAPLWPPIWAHWCFWRMRLNFCFYQPTRVHNPNGKSISSVVFAQLMAECC